MVDQIVSQRVHLVLSDTTKAITSFLFEGVALPEYLTKYGHLLVAFTSGAAAATALHVYLHRNRLSRAKVKLAVYHITRIVSNTPNLYALLDRPQELIKLMDKEVMQMIDDQLTKSEATETMTQLKRSIWKSNGEEPERPRKRSKSWPPDMLTGVAKHSGFMKGDVIETGRSLPHSQSDADLHLPDEAQSQEDITMLDIQQSSSPPQSTPCPQGISKTSQAIPSQDAPSSVHPKPRHRAARDQNSPTFPSLPQLPSAMASSPPPSTAQPSSLDSSSSKESVKLPSSPTPAPRGKSPKASGYGLDYSDEDLYSKLSPAISEKASSPNDKQSPIESLGLLEAAFGRALDPNAIGNCAYQSPVLGQPKAKKPPSCFALQRPPNTMALRIGNVNRGTWLFPIQEGVSPQEDLSASTNGYRVAETRQYYNDIVTARKKRRSIREFFQKGKEVEGTRDFEESHASPHGSHTPKGSPHPPPRGSSPMGIPTLFESENPGSASPTIVRVASAPEKLPSTPSEIIDCPMKGTKPRIFDSPMPSSRGGGPRRKTDKELRMPGTPVSLRKSTRKNAYKGSFAE